ncbi:hypothetical protein GGI20_005775 [Coemansia sp. BCRC 34301]|nr:hypothetical protein GGI20_005775 [Coemansia sp. BCRC 34301]
MSQPRSTFQRLPGFILKRICQFTVLRNTDQRKPLHSDGSFRYTNRLDLFNSLCQEWTQVASELYFKDYKIDIRGDKNSACGAHVLKTLDVPELSILSVVRNVDVSLSFADVISGKALSLLKSSIYLAATFPVARTVTIAFTDNSDIASAGSECLVEHVNVVESLTEFAEAVKSMLPRLNKIRIVTGVDENILPYNFYAAFVEFVKLTHAINNNSLLEVIWPRYASQASPTLVTGLSGIHIIKPREASIVEALIHKNASTLATLSISHIRSATYVNVFETPQGEAVAYPLLEKLVISSMDKVPKPKYSREHAPVLLPRLAKLSVKWGHPFHDDVLFRGNNATLKEVVLMLDIDFMTLLQKFKVFEGASHSKLLRLTLWRNPLSVVDKDEQERLICLLALDMAPKVPSLYVQGRLKFGLLVAGITQNGPILSLQTLKLINSSLPFGSFLALVKSLPNLNQIAIMRLIPDPDYLQTDPRIQLENLHASYYPLSNRLQYVKYLAGSTGDSMEHDARCSMFLALLCPRFTWFVVSSWLRKNYNRSIRKAIKTEPFVNYADRLRRLAISDVDENNMKFKARPLKACSKTSN